MNTAAQQTTSIRIGDLQPGTSLIDKYQKKERVIRQVQKFNTSVRLYFENDVEPFTCSFEEFRSRFEIVSQMLFKQMRIW